MTIAKRVTWGLAAWLVPGAGHALKGELAKGGLCAFALLGCFAAGQAMSEVRAVSRHEHPIAFWAQVGAGGPTLVSAWYDDRSHGPWGANGGAPAPVPRLLDCGIMYTCVAGLLNFVLVVDLLFPLVPSSKEAGR